MPEIYLGIDFGTTNSLVCMLDANNKPVPVRNQYAWTQSDPEYYQWITPSALAIEHDHLLHGLRAKKSQGNNVILSIKRVLGRLDEHRDEIKIEFGGQWYHPSQLACYLFRQLKYETEVTLGQQVKKAVITVPANSKGPQRSKTRESAVQAGFEVVTLINEPTAAAMAYGLGSSAHETVLVYDFGGGTFDVTLLEIENGMFAEISAKGVGKLGGDDLDRRLAQLALQKTNQSLPKDSIEDKLFLRECERAKIELSDKEEVEISFTHGSVHIRCTIRRAEFEAAIHDLVEQTREPVEKVLADTRTYNGFPADRPAKELINHVLLVGGTCKIPYIRQYVKKLLTSFKLTQQSLTDLGKNGLPAELLIKLEALRNKEVTTEDNFICQIKELIGQDQTDKYKSLILKHAERFEIEPLSDARIDPLMCVAQGAAVANGIINRRFPDYDYMVKLEHSLGTSVTQSDINSSEQAIEAVLQLFSRGEFVSGFRNVLMASSLLKKLRAEHSEEDFKKLKDLLSQQQVSPPIKATGLLSLLENEDGFNFVSQFIQDDARLREFLTHLGKTVGQANVIERLLGSLSGRVDILYQYLNLIRLLSRIFEENKLRSIIERGKDIPMESSKAESGLHWSIIETNSYEYSMIFYEGDHFDLINHPDNVCIGSAECRIPENADKRTFVTKTTFHYGRDGILTVKRKIEYKDTADLPHTQDLGDLELFKPGAGQAIDDALFAEALAMLKRRDEIPDLDLEAWFDQLIAAILNNDPNLVRRILDSILSRRQELGY